MIQTYGPHAVTNASIENPILDTMLQQLGRKVRVLYSDPPWGDGNMKYWVTMNKKMTGASYTPLTYDALLARIYHLVAHYVDGHVFIETGPKWAPRLEQDFKTRFHNVRSFVTKYAAGQKEKLDCILIYGGTAPQYRSGYDPTGEFGGKVAKNCIRPLVAPGDVVLDPCCGMGYTAQAAIDLGCHFRGNEFNAARLAKTIARLEKSLP